ncbi:MAG: hypothetical protein HW419_2756 [Deltaproteobacteria bacterium]|nr:hypothetical protein [Deltaproteobacteria bacterium]
MQRETNRPEEKFDERANEDSYFAAKEFDLIEELKTEFQILKRPGAKRG